MENVQCTEQWISEELVLERYYKYKNMLFQIAFSYLGNKHDCEDILQEAFIKLYYYAPEFEQEENEKRWLIRITINLCKNHLKSFWNRRKIPIDDMDEFAYSQEDKEIMSDILRLPVKYKTIIQLYYITGYKISEISEILSLSESAVKMRLKRGRELLKAEIEEEV